MFIIKCDCLNILLVKNFEKKSENVQIIPLIYKFFNAQYYITDFLLQRDNAHYLTWALQS